MCKLQYKRTQVVYAPLQRGARLPLLHQLRAEELGVVDRLLARLLDLGWTIRWVAQSAGAARRGAWGGASNPRSSAARSGARASAAPLGGGAGPPAAAGRRHQPAHFRGHCGLRRRPPGKGEQQRTFRSRLVGSRLMAAASCRHKIAPWVAGVPVTAQAPAGSAAAALETPSQSFGGPQPLHTDLEGA